MPMPPTPAVPRILYPPTCSSTVSGRAEEFTASSNPSFCVEEVRCSCAKRRRNFSWPQVEANHTSGDRWLQANGERGPNLVKAHPLKARHRLNRRTTHE